MSALRWRTMSRGWSILILFMVAAMIFSSCGGSQQPAPAATEAPAAEATTAPEPTEAPAAAEPTAASEATEATKASTAAEEAAAAPGTYAEAPMLADLVAAGTLPPVDQRLPEEPLVLEPVSEPGTYGGTLRMADVSDIGGNTQMALYVEPFTKHTRDLKGERPNLLTKWEYSADNQELTVHFRKGVKWSDGESLTVDDYLFWWNDMVMDPDIAIAKPSETNPDGNPMQVTKIDDYTLKYTFASPQPFFLELHNVGFWTSTHYVVPAHYLKQFHPKYNTEVKDNKELLDRYNNWQHYPDYPVFTAWRLVEYQSGQRAVYERNPYYWKVDPQGQQLPYIDRVEVTAVKDAQVMLLDDLAGNIDFQVRNFNLKDVPVLKENEEKGGYQIMMWDQGDISWPWLMIQYDYQDEAVTDLFYNADFRRALSVAIDRNRLNDIVSLGLGQPRQPAMDPNNPEFQSPEGQAIYDAYAHSYIDYDPEQAKQWLDGINMKDIDGDGFRERPDGQKFELIVDADVTDKITTDSCDFIKEDWEAVGIKTTINVTDGTVLDQRTKNREQMIRAWGQAGSDWLFTAPPVWTPIYNVDWTIGGQSIGEYYETGGKSGTAPRPGSALEKLQQIFTEAKALPTREERFKKILEGYQVHIDEGPITIGTVGEHVSPVLVKNGLTNITDKAIVSSWNMSYPGTADPEQWFYKK